MFMVRVVVFSVVGSLDGGVVIGLVGVGVGLLVCVKVVLMVGMICEMFNGLMR